jgi:hypothetical protein
MTVSRRIGFLAGGCIAAAVACGVALAAVTLPFTGDGNTIAGCYSSGGAVKVRTPAEPVCPRGYAPLEWGVTGPQGAQGPQGPQGSQGPAGPPGPAGSGHAYFAENARRITVETQGTEELVGLSELPAGTYMAWFTVYINDGFEGLEGGNTNFVRCVLAASGADVADAMSVMDEESAGSFDRGALSGVAVATLPANGTLIVRCGKRLGDPPLAHGRIAALRVGGLN